MENCKNAILFKANEVVTLVKVTRNHSLLVYEIDYHEIQ